MTTAIEPITEQRRMQTAHALQNLLPHLVALHLDAKQVEWNLSGDDSDLVQRLAREIAADARGWSDRVATRAVALGLRLDVRPGAFAAIAASIRKFPAGAGLSPTFDQGAAAAALAEVVEQVATVAVRTAEQIEPADEVSYVLVRDLLRHLEAYSAALAALT